MSTTTPYAKLRASINGGAPQTGGITVPASATVSLSFEDTTGWTAYVITMYPPASFALPSGWTNNGDNSYSYTGVTAPPPLFTLPAITGWGKWIFALVVNGGTKNGQAGNVDMTYTATALSMLSVNAIEDTGTLEETQFYATKAWGGAIQVALRALDAFISAGAVVADATTTVKGVLKLAGDLAGTAALPVVAKINGIAITGTPATGYVPVATGTTAATWQAAPGGAPSGAASGDLANTYPGPSVAKVNGIAYPSGALTIGQVPRATGVGTVVYGAIDPTVAASFAAASEARGDILYRGASGWVRLAAGTSGQLLKTNGAGADPAWVTPSPSPLLAQNVLTTAGTAVANVDTLIYTVPASPTGNFRALLAAVVGRMKTGLTGAGKVTVRVGTTSGGNDLVVDTDIVTATTVGTELGVASAVQGTAFTSANLYNALLAAGTTIYVRMATTGVVTVAPTFEWTLFGVAMGT